MKIDKVILSSDANEEYLQFWPIVSKAWKNLNIEPVLFYTGKNPIYEEGVHNFHIENIDQTFAAQNIRLLAPALFKDEVCIISDIDNMPLSQDYFQKNIELIENDKFVIFRPESTTKDMISIMWNVALGKTWSEIFKIEKISEIKEKLIEWYPKDYIKLKKNWYFDQKALKSNLDTFAESNSDRIIKLNDSDAGFCRLDRGDYSIFFRLFYDKKKTYSDFHMPRPYVKYKKTINKVYDLHFSGLQ